MARIRTIKPEFWQDEKLAPLPPLDRLVFLGLISQADDAGRLVDNPKTLDGLLFPYTDDSCSSSLAVLANAGRILRYTSDSGQPLIQVTNWERHQRVPNPSKYNLPAPSTEDVATTEDTKSSVNPNENLRRTDVESKVPIPDPIPSTSEHRPPSEAKASGASAVVETCGKLDGPPPESTPWKEAAGWWAPFLREHSVEPDRSMSVVQQNLRKHRPETIRDAVLGFCAMRDAGELREGLGWAPGEVITLLPLNKSTNGRSNLQLAADKWRKATEAKGSKSGMKLIKDVLGAA